MSVSVPDTPWERLSRSYLEIEAAGHDFPIPLSYLPDEGVRVLDMGCGVGTHMRMFLTRTAEVVGIDYSAAMTRAASAVAPVAQADSRALPFRDEVFDYLWSRVVISCVPDWGTAFEEALRVVRPGGRLVLLLSNKWSVMSPFRAMLSLFGRYSEGYIKHLSCGDLLKHKGNCSFRIVEAFATQKPARSENPLFLIGAKLFYSVDRMIARLFPRWGGDLCVVLERGDAAARARERLSAGTR